MDGIAGGPVLLSEGLDLLQLVVILTGKEATALRTADWVVMEKRTGLFGEFSVSC